MAYTGRFGQSDDFRLVILPTLAVYKLTNETTTRKQ